MQYNLYTPTIHSFAHPTTQVSDSYNFHRINIIKWFKYLPIAYLNVKNELNKSHGFRN